jgi:hypothetical protein
MNIEKDYEKIDLKNVMFKDYTEQTQNLKEVLNNIVIYFSSISTLKGEKTLLEQAFQDTKKQILEYHG